MKSKELHPSVKYVHCDCGFVFIVLFRWVESLEEINTLLYPCLVSSTTAQWNLLEGTILNNVIRSKGTHPWSIIQL